MVAPFDYTSAFGQQGGPFGSLSQGLQLGAQLAQADQQTALRKAQTAKIQQELAANQAKAVQQQKLGEAYTSLVDKVRSDTWQPADFQGVALLAPKEQSEAAIKFFDTLSKDRQAQVLSSTTQVMAALGSKNPEIGIELLNQRAEGFRKRGDEGQARFLETQAKLAAIDPALVVATLGDTLIGLPGGKDAMDSLAKRNEDRRAAAKEPLVVAELQSKVDEAQIKLRRLDAIQQAELTKAESVAERERIQAKFAERLARADLDLKGAQAAAQQATTRMTDAQLEDIKRKASQGPTPVFNQQLGGFVVAPSAQNPNGNFIPLNKAVDIKDQRSAVNALKAAGYDPETGEDRVSRLINLSTSGKIQAMTAAGLGAFNITTSGMKAINELAATANSIALEILDGKIGAGVSNADRDFIVGTLGDVANPQKTSEERLAGWLSAKNRMLVSGLLPPPPKSKARASGQVTPAPAGGVDMNNPLLRPR